MNSITSISHADMIPNCKSCENYLPIDQNEYSGIEPISWGNVLEKKSNMFKFLMLCFQSFIMIGLTNQNFMIY